MAYILVGLTVAPPSELSLKYNELHEGTIIFIVSNHNNLDVICASSLNA